jgi:hypothetical protein
MIDTASIVEFRRRSAAGIYAVPYRNLRRCKPVRLPDGAIAETPTPDERLEAPDRLADCFEVAAGGGPATIHHVNLGLVTALLAFEGVYLLSSGEIAAVYGAEVLPIG